jgi:CRP-like cAMP-binding protein
MNSNDLCADYLSSEWDKTPGQAGDVLKDIIRKHGVTRYAKSGSVIRGDEFLSNVFWIDSGVLLLRPNALNSIGTFDSETMVGISNIFQGSMTGHYLEVVEDARYISCPVEYFRQNLNDCRLALAVAEHVNRQAMMMAFFVSVILKEDAYGKVKFALELLSRASVDFRDHVSVVRFVCERTGVSKAHAHSILKQLRLGGYIEMASGNLVRIFKRLPEAY